MKRLILVGLLALPGAAMAQVRPENIHQYKECVRNLAALVDQISQAEGFWNDVASEASADVVSAATQLGLASIDALNALADECEEIRKG